MTLVSPKGQPPLDPKSDTPEGQTDLTRRFNQDPGVQAVLAKTGLLADVGALDMAILRCQPWPGLIHHSDRRVHYAAHRYRRPLQAHGIHCSMSRKGDCWDGAPVQSFIASFKGETVGHADDLARAMARADLLHDLDGFDNRRRLHAGIGHLTPEQKMLLAA